MDEGGVQLNSYEKTIAGKIDSAAYRRHARESAGADRLKS